VVDADVLVAVPSRFVLDVDDLKSPLREALEHAAQFRRT
jgi:hypothetical protein